MTKPTVHLNGTSRDELKRQLKKAYGSIFDAIRDVAAAAPNARDYYPQGPTIYAAAAAEHRSRVDRLVAVQAELLELFEAVDQ